MSSTALKRQIDVATAALTRAQAEQAAAQNALAAAQTAYNTAVAQRRPALLLQRLNRTVASATSRLANATRTVQRRQAELNALLAQVPAPAPAPAPVGRLARALLVGINYVGTPNELYGCINDVLNVESQLRTFFPGSTEYRLLTDNTPMKPTRTNMLASINWLMSGLQPGENVFFHYSGHGGRIRDTNGDEVSGLDSCIYPCNDGRIETITDDELRSSLAMRLPAGCKCFVVLDACHSGTGVDLRYLWQTPASGSLSYTEDMKYEKTAGDIVFLSGCMDTQTAADTVDNTERPAGALTWALLDTWRSYGRAIKTKYLLWDIRAFLKKNGYPQVPQLSTGRYTDLQGVFDLGSA